MSPHRTRTDGSTPDAVEKSSECGMFSKTRFGLVMNKTPITTILDGGGLSVCECHPCSFHHDAAALQRFAAVLFVSIVARDRWLQPERTERALSGCSMSFPLLIRRPS
jgi:hypothetical protein